MHSHDGSPDVPRAKTAPVTFHGRGHSPTESVVDDMASIVAEAGQHALNLAETVTERLRPANEPCDVVKVVLDPSFTQATHSRSMPWEARLAPPHVSGGLRSSSKLRPESAASQTSSSAALLASYAAYGVTTKAASRPSSAACRTTSASANAVGRTSGRPSRPSSAVQVSRQGSVERHPPQLELARRGTAGSAIQEERTRLAAQSGSTQLLQQALVEERSKQRPWFTKHHLTFGGTRNGSFRSEHREYFDAQRAVSMEHFQHELLHGLDAAGSAWSAGSPTDAAASRAATFAELRASPALPCQSSSSEHRPVQFDNAVCPGRATTAAAAATDNRAASRPQSAASRPQSAAMRRSRSGRLATKPDVIEEAVARAVQKVAAQAVQQADRHSNSHSKDPPGNVGSSRPVSACGVRTAKAATAGATRQLPESACIDAAWASWARDRLGHKRSTVGGRGRCRSQGSSLRRSRIPRCHASTGRTVANSSEASRESTLLPDEASFQSMPT